MMRDVAWGFFYGWVNFDEVIGTRNHYGKVDLYAGAYNASFKEAGVDYTQQFETPLIMATFKAILRDWVNEGFDPFAAPEETGSAFGTQARRQHRGDRAHAHRDASACLASKATRRCATTCRSIASSPMSSQDEPEIHARARFRGRAACVQSLQVPVALGRDVESVGDVGVQAEPVLPDHRGVRAAGLPRQRSRRVVPADCPTRSSGTSPTRTLASRAPASR